MLKQPLLLLERWFFKSLLQRDFRLFRLKINTHILNFNNMP